MKLVISALSLFYLTFYKAPISVYVTLEIYKLDFYAGRVMMAEKLLGLVGKKYANYGRRWTRYYRHR